MSSIKALDEITFDDLDRVGGKALNCARLLKAVLPAPDGFVVLAGAGQLAEADIGVGGVCKENSE